MNTNPVLVRLLADLVEQAMKRDEITERGGVESPPPAKLPRTEKSA